MVATPEEKNAGRVSHCLLLPHLNLVRTEGGLAAGNNRNPKKQQHLQSDITALAGSGKHS